MKTKLQKLLVCLLVFIMFLTSNGTLVLGAELNEVFESNEVAVENVVENEVAEDVLEVDTDEEILNELHIELEVIRSTD